MRLVFASCGKCFLTNHTCLFRAVVRIIALSKGYYNDSSGLMYIYIRVTWANRPQRENEIDKDSEEDTETYRGPLCLPETS